MPDKDYSTKAPHAENSAQDAYAEEHEAEARAGAEAAETEAEEAAQAISGEESPSPADVIAKLAEENAELKEQLMRAAADMENLRKRTEREIADAKAYAAARFARDMLSVADNLNRALSAIPPQARQADAQLKTLADGVEMTERTMMSALQNHGIRKIEAVGQKFDPHLHEAMFETQDKSVPHNTVSQEVQAGYMIGERVLRAAQVGIAKGGGKQAQAPEKDS